MERGGLALEQSSSLISKLENHPRLLLSRERTNVADLVAGL
jgi:hypothetical protein